MTYRAWWQRPAERVPQAGREYVPTVGEWFTIDRRSDGDRSWIGDTLKCIARDGNLVLFTRLGDREDYPHRPADLRTATLRPLSDKYVQAQREHYQKWRDSMSFIGNAEKAS